MLTPAFNLSQDDNFLLLKIKAPYTKVSETEIYFEGTDFRFYSKPYFLRLNLPGQVVETGSEMAAYDVDEGSFSIQIPKACPGQWFEGLDLQTKLLAPKGKLASGPTIEVLGTENSSLDLDACKDDDNFDWEIYQNQYIEEDDNLEVSLLEKVTYGFASLKTDTKLFSRLQDEMPDLLDIRVHGCSSAARRREKMQKEEVDFSEDHYLADLYETEEISTLSAYKPWWCELEEQMSENPSLHLDQLVVFSEAERSKMRRLPRKEYLLDRPTKQEVLLSLVDILFAYAYDVRTTEGEHTVESAWTICKLSSTLSWLETFYSLESVVVSSIRRSLCYPLYRHWNMALIILNDTIKIISLGPRAVLKCLLEIHSLFNESEPRYILNDLYVTDYCVWIQTVKCKVFLALAEALKKVTISKSSVSLDLLELELAADDVLKAEDDENKSSVENITGRLCELGLKNADHSTDGNTNPECGFESSDSDSSNDEASSDNLCQHEIETSDSDSSEDDDSSSSLDSDDYSSTDHEDSSDEDDDDSDSHDVGGAEKCLLLGNFHTIEKIR